MAAVKTKARSRPKYVVATTSFAYTDKAGNVLLVHEGEEHPATSEAVKGRRELFEAKK